MDNKKFFKFIQSHNTDTRITLLGNSIIFAFKISLDIGECWKCMNQMCRVFSIFRQLPTEVGRPLGDSLHPWREVDTLNNFLISHEPRHLESTSERANENLLVLFEPTAPNDEHLGELASCSVLI